MRQRVAITGMGVMTPLGNSIDTLWQSLCSGQDGIGQVSVCDLSDFTYQQGGEVKELVIPENLSRYLENKDRSTLLTVAAAEQALKQAGPLQGKKVAVVLATNFGSVASAESGLGGRDIPASGDLGFREACDTVGAIWGCTGPVTCLSLSCSSGSSAIGYGMDLIRNGHAEAVIAGGYDAISRFAWAGLSVLRTMTQDKIRPFSLDRAGTLFSEGAGIVVLEKMDDAIVGGKKVWAELCGFGFNNNAYHMTAPAKEGKGLADAMSMALKDAGLDPSKVDHVNTHGTGTKYNDVTETQAIKTCLGAHAADIAITSNKSMLGHLMGAAGSVEAIVSVLSIANNCIPPTINMTEPDPECDLELPTDAPLEREVNTVITNSSGIGGNNVSLVISAVEVAK